MDDTLNELIKQAKREYHREWYRKNKAKVAVINRRYWEKKAAARLAEQQKVNDDERKD